jgi:hypothetical protein
MLLPRNPIFCLGRPSSCCPYDQRTGNRGDLGWDLLASTSFNSFKDSGCVQTKLGGSASALLAWQAAGILLCQGGQERLQAYSQHGRSVALCPLLTSWPTNKLPS